MSQTKWIWLLEAPVETHLAGRELAHILLIDREGGLSMELPVLIIEEDQAVRVMLQEFLEGYPFHLRCLGKVTSMSRRQFRDAVNGFVPKVVLSDIQILMDGGQKVLEWVQDLPHKPTCILLSAGLTFFWSTLEDRFKSIHVLEKPFSLLELVNIIKGIDLHPSLGSESHD